LSSSGKVRVVVRSREVPIRTVDFNEPVYSTSGALLWTRKSTLVLYDSVLDEEHKRAIEEGHKLSHKLGLELEVIDASKGGVIRKALSSLGIGRPGPTLEVSPQADECEGGISHEFHGPVAPA
jgi:hypothetical protein